ncbi:hypothetical protein HDU77_007075 [Chytriomyces hyalinus]|nr:hypothetical protein HDU77_007075 [Chytriomyces hyalinus]
MSDDEEDYPACGGGPDDEEVGLPKKFVHVISSEGTYIHAYECEFTSNSNPILNVHIFCSNDVCEKELKKTISGEHLLAALKVLKDHPLLGTAHLEQSLGFEDYISEVNGALDDHTKLSKVHFSDFAICITR